LEKDFNFGIYLLKRIGRISRRGLRKNFEAKIRRGLKVGGKFPSFWRNWGLLGQLIGT